MDDLISRQAAIDAIGKTSDELYENIKKGATFPQRQWFDGMAQAQSILEDLPSAQPTIYGYDVKELIVFADAVRKKGITESEIHEFALNAKSAYEYAWEEFQRTQKEALDSVMRGDHNE